MLIPKFQFSNTLVLDFSIVSFHWNVIMNSRFIVLVLFLALLSGSLARPQASKGPKDPELSTNDQEKDDERRASKEPKDPKLNSNDKEDVERSASRWFDVINCPPWVPACARSDAELETGGATF